MQFRDSVRVKGRIEIWKHEPTKDYRTGNLIYSAPNNAGSVLKQQMLRRLMNCVPPEIARAPGLPDPFLDGGIPVSFINYGDNVAVKSRVKAVRRVVMDDDQNLRFVSTLRPGELADCNLNIFTLDGSVGSSLGNIDSALLYSTGNDTLLNNIPVAYVTSPTFMYLIGSADPSGFNQQLFTPSRQYDPEDENDTPVNLGDYRIVRKVADGKWYIKYETGGVTPANGSGMTLCTNNQHKNNGGAGEFAIAYVNPTISWTNIYALSVAWVLSIL